MPLPFHAPYQFPALPSLLLPPCLSPRQLHSVLKCQYQSNYFIIQLQRLIQFALHKQELVNKMNEQFLCLFVLCIQNFALHRLKEGVIDLTQLLLLLLFILVTIDVVLFMFWECCCRRCCLRRRCSGDDCNCCQYLMMLLLIWWFSLCFCSSVSNPALTLLSLIFLLPRPPPVNLSLSLYLSFPLLPRFPIPPFSLALLHVSTSGS